MTIVTEIERVLLLGIAVSLLAVLEEGRKMVGLAAWSLACVLTVTR